MTKTSEGKFEFYLVNSYLRKVKVKLHIVLKNKKELVVLNNNSDGNIREKDAKEICKMLNIDNYEKQNSLRLFFGNVNKLGNPKLTEINTNKPKEFNETIERYAGIERGSEFSVLKISECFHLNYKRNDEPGIINCYSIDDFKAQLTKLNEGAILKLNTFNINVKVKHYLKSSQSSQHPFSEVLNEIENTTKFMQYVEKNPKEGSPAQASSISQWKSNIKDYYFPYLYLNKNDMLKAFHSVSWSMGPSGFTMRRYEPVGKQCLEYKPQNTELKWGNKTCKINELNFYIFKSDAIKSVYYSTPSAIKSSGKKFCKSKFSHITYFHNSKDELYKAITQPIKPQFSITNGKIWENILPLLEEWPKYAHNEENFLKWMQFINACPEAKNCIDNTSYEFKKFDRICIIEPEILKQAYDQSSLKQLVATQNIDKAAFFDEYANLVVKLDIQRNQEVIDKAKEIFQSNPDIENLGTKLQALEKIPSLLVVFITNNPIDNNGFDLIHKESIYENIICELFNIRANYVHYLNSLIKNGNDQDFKDMPQFEYPYYQNYRGLDILIKHDPKLEELLISKMNLGVDELCGYSKDNIVITYIEGIVKLYQATKDQAMKSAQNNEGEMHKVEADNTPALQLTPVDDINEGHMEEIREGCMEDPNPAKQNVAGAEHAYQSFE